VSAHFDAGFSGHGFELFEHWENDGQYLLLVTSDLTQIGNLKPGDDIVRRTWGAAGHPAVVNHAKRVPDLLAALRDSFVIERKAADQ
jgi:hypothetical protein